MGRVSLRKLVLHNFRSFLGRHELEFPATGLVIIHGVNRLTGGSSNAGKTNVLLALAYAFGYCPYPAQVLQCWETEEPMKVEVHLDTDDGPAVIERGEGKLRLTNGGHLFKGGAKAVEAEVDRLCGVPSDLREVLTYRDQVEPRKFLDVRQRPGERDAAMKGFLTKVLRLEVFDREVDQAAKALAPLEARGREVAAQLQTAQDALGAAQQDPALVWTPEPLEALEEALVNADVQAKRAANALTAANEARSRLAQAAADAAKQVDAEVDREVALLEARKALIEGEDVGESADQGELLRLGEQADKCRDFIRIVQAENDLAHAAYDSETALIRAAVKRLAALRAEAEDLKLNACPTCSREWPQAQERLQAVSALIAEDERTIKAFGVVDDLHAVLDARRYTPDPRLERLKAVHAKLREQMAAESSRLRSQDEVRKAERAQRVAEVQLLINAAEARRVAGSSPELAAAVDEVQRLTRVYGEAQLAYTGAEGAVALARQRNRYGQEARAAAEGRVRAAAMRVDAARKEHAELRARWRQEADYVDLLKSFRNKVFDEVLAAIGQRASEVVAMLPNASHVSVEFRSERTTGTGTVQDRITPVVYLNGKERRLKESVNGGALTSIELAVDLAVVQAVSERLGCNLNWVVLDEAFNGHDPVTKAACLEMLQRYAADKLVLIVDHHAEVREMFTQMVVVEYDGKLSKFKSAP